MRGVPRRKRVLRNRPSGHQAFDAAITAIECSVVARDGVFPRVVVSLNDCRWVIEATEGLRRYFRFYNEERFHQALGYRPPSKAYAERVRRDAIWWPQVRRAGSGRNKKHRSLFVVFGRIGKHLSRAAVLRCSSGRHGFAGQSRREAVKPKSDRPQEQRFSKRFPDHPEKSRVYHYDTMPRGWPSVRFLSPGGICIPSESARPADAHETVGRRVHSRHSPRQRRLTAMSHPLVGEVHPDSNGAVCHKCPVGETAVPTRPAGHLQAGDGLTTGISTLGLSHGAKGLLEPPPGQPATEQKSAALTNTRWSSQ